MAPGRRLKATLMLVVATAAWGYSFPASKALFLATGQAMPGHDGWFFAALVGSARFALAGLIVFAFHPRAFVKMRSSEWKQGLGLGVFSGLGMLFQADGLNHTQASTVAFVTQFSAVLVPLWIGLSRRRLPSLLTLACLVLVMGGVGVLGNFNWHTLQFGRGEGETLIGTIFFTAQILLLDRRSFRGNDSQRVSIVMFAAIAATLTPVWLYHAHALSDVMVLFASAPIFLTFLSVTIVCSIVAFLLMNRWQPSVDATTAGIIYCAEPLFATLLALVLPVPLARYLGVTYANESFTPHLLIGGSLITLANLLLAAHPRTSSDSAFARDRHQPYGLKRFR